MVDERPDPGTIKLESTSVPDEEAGSKQIPNKDENPAEIGGNSETDDAISKKPSTAQTSGKLVVDALFLGSFVVSME